MTDRLAIYNGALMACGERGIANLNVNEEGRRLLDTVWNDDGVKHCLEAAQWKFAMCGAKFSYDTAVTPQWGFKRAFAKPADWVVTSAVCQDEYFRAPLLQYSDEASYWFADLDQIYVKYVSTLPAFGTNYAAWPSSFTNYVHQYFASKIIMKLTSDTARQDRILGKNRDGKDGSMARCLIEAKNRDAMAGPTTFPAQGAWNSARRGRRAVGYLDGGNRSQLIG